MRSILNLSWESSLGSHATLETILNDVIDRDFFAPFIDGYVKARGTNLMPLLHDLMLDSLVPYLKNATVIEPGEGRSIVYRLCGTDVVKRMGRDLTGTNTLDVVPVKYHNAYLENIRRVMETGCGHYGRHHNKYESGKIIDAEVLTLPVLSGGDTGECYLLSLHSVEHTPQPGKPIDRVESAEWSQAVFIDAGNGVPRHQPLDAVG